MPSDEVVKKLADIVKTSHSKNRLLGELEEFTINKAVITQKVQGEGQAIDYENYPLIKGVIQELGDALGINFNQIPSDTTLQDLKTLLTNLEEITVELPSNLETTEKTRPSQPITLTDQIIGAVDPPAIVTTTPTNDFVSGLTLSYKGRYVNLTLDRIIKEKLHG